MNVALQLLEEDERKFMDEIRKEYVQKQIAQERQKIVYECSLEIEKIKSIFDRQMGA